MQLNCTSNEMFSSLLLWRILLLIGCFNIYKNKNIVKQHVLPINECFLFELLYDNHIKKDEN